MRNSKTYFPSAGGSTGPTTDEKATEFSANVRLNDSGSWVSWPLAGVMGNSISLAHGSGVEPTINVTGRGIFYKKGTVLKELQVLGSFDANGATDIQVFLRADVSDFNNVATSTPTLRVVDTVLGVTSMESGLAYTNMNITIIDLNNYVMPEDGFLGVYFKGVGTYTGTRSYYIDSKIIWE